MKTILQLEELVMFVLGLFAFNQLDFAWWWFLILILMPDVGMLGYLFNAKVGAITYNIFHHKGIAIFIYFVGVYFQNETMQLTGVIVFSHASLDRGFGYGLKFFDDFKHTHLEQIGKV
jgi:hypothetical protein